MQHQTPEAHTIHVGSTKPQHSTASPDLPLALSALLITTINLTSHLTPLGFSFASVAFVLALLNVITLSRKPILITRPANILLFTFTCVAFLFSRTAPLGKEAESNIHLSPHSSLSMKAVYDGQSHSSEVITSTSRMLKADESSVPVDALKAVERSQHALPNSGDSDTEARENRLDETRVLNDHGDHRRAWEVLEREEGPPNLNGTFIVTTHRGESCFSSCARYNYVCSPESFGVVNSCQVLTLRLSCTQCSQLSQTDSLASTLPGAVYDAKEKATFCFTLNQSDLEATLCQTSTWNMKRLCPCIA